MCFYLLAPRLETGTFNSLQSKVIYSACIIPYQCTLSDLIDEGYVQNDLFDLHVVNDEKAEIFKTIDMLNQKHGRHIVHLASSMKGILRQRSEYAGRSQMNFFDRIKKSGKELYIPYLGETR